MVHPKLPVKILLFSIEHGNLHNFCFKTCEYFVLQGCSNFRFHGYCWRHHCPSSSARHACCHPTGILCPGPGLVPHPYLCISGPFQALMYTQDWLPLWTQFAVPGPELTTHWLLEDHYSSDVLPPCTTYACVCVFHRSICWQNSS